MFERTDKNSDGHLTRAEVIRALKSDIEVNLASTNGSIQTDVCVQLPQLLHMPEKVETALARANTQNEFEEVRGALAMEVLVVCSHPAQHATCSKGEPLAPHIVSSGSRQAARSTTGRACAIWC